MTGKTYQRKWLVYRVCPGISDVMLNPGRKRNWEYGWGWVGAGRWQEKYKRGSRFPPSVVPTSKAPAEYSTQVQTANPTETPLQRDYSGLPLLSASV